MADALITVVQGKAQVDVSGAALLAPLVAVATKAAGKADDAKAAVVGLAGQLTSLTASVAQVGLTDDGMLPIQLSSGGRLQLARSVVTGLLFDPENQIQVGVTDDGTLPIKFARLAGGSLRVIESAQPWNGNAAAAPTETVFPNDARLTLDGFVQVVQRTATGFQPKRPFVQDGGPGAGMAYVTPGARCAFYSAADQVSFDVVFRGTVAGVVADTQAPTPYRASILVNGVAAGTIDSGSTGAGDDAQTGTVTGLGAGAKLVELIWPYARPMTLMAIRQTVGGGVGQAGTPARRMTAQVDSISHGRTVSRPELGWSVAAARGAGFELINLGFSGRQLSAGDGTLSGSVAGLKVSTCMSGANEYQNNQYGPDGLGAKVTEWLTEWFAAAPADAHAVMISQTWCANDGANPAGGTGAVNGLGYRAQDYRLAFENAVTAYCNANPSRASRVHLLHGLSMIANSADRFVDGLHPNDAGAAEFTANLAPTLNAIKGS